MDPSKTRPPQDRTRISLRKARDVDYWTKELEVSKWELASLVRKVGNSVDDVRKELGR